MTHTVTDAEIATATGMTQKHIRRVCADMQSRHRIAWHGAVVDCDLRDGVWHVAYASLPRDVREALTMQDQMDLPLPPP